MTAIENQIADAQKQGEQKIEQQITQNFDAQYQELLKKDQEAIEAKLRGEATQKFDEVRKLGFATTKDVDDKIQAIFGKFVSELQALREENTKLREWVMRAKAQGLNTGRLDEEIPREESVLKDWERPFLREFEQQRRGIKR